MSHPTKQQEKQKPTLEALQHDIEQLQEQNTKILRRITIMTIANYARFLILLVPIVLGAIFLPGFLRELTAGLEGWSSDPLGAILNQYQQQ